MSNSQWFEGLLQVSDTRSGIGDAAQIRASYVRKQKTESAGCDAHPEVAAGEMYNTVHLKQRSKGTVRSVQP